MANLTTHSYFTVIKQSVSNRVNRNREPGKIFFKPKIIKGSQGQRVSQRALIAETGLRGTLNLCLGLLHLYHVHSLAVKIPLWVQSKKCVQHPTLSLVNNETGLFTAKLQIPPRMFLSLHCFHPSSTSGPESAKSPQCLGLMLLRTGDHERMQKYLASKVTLLASMGASCEREICYCGFVEK